jgi:hypothetical protein
MDSWQEYVLGMSVIQFKNCYHQQPEDDIISKYVIVYLEIITQYL